MEEEFKKLDGGGNLHNKISAHSQPVLSHAGNTNKHYYY